MTIIEGGLGDPQVIALQKLKAAAIAFLSVWAGETLARRLPEWPPVLREKARKINGLIVGRDSEITPDDLDRQAIKGNRLTVQIIGFAPLLQKTGFHFFARRFNRRRCVEAARRR